MMNYRYCEKIIRMFFVETDSTKMDSLSKCCRFWEINGSRIRFWEDGPSEDHEESFQQSLSSPQPPDWSGRMSIEIWLINV